MRKQDNFLKNNKRIIRCAKYNGKATVQPVVERKANIYENGDVPQKISFIVKCEEYDVFSVNTTLLMPFDCELPLKIYEAKSGETVTAQLPDLTEFYGVFHINVIVRNQKGELLCEQLIPFSHVRTGSGSFKKSGSLAHIINHDVPSSYELIDLYKKCGMRKMRVDFTWRFVELQKGILKIPERWCNIVDYLHKNGIEIHAVLNYGCEFYDDFKAPYTEDGLDAWLNYCRFTVNHFKGVVKHYEVWNEYNLCMGNAPGTPEKYAELLKPTYTAIKEIDPEIVVTAGVTCNTQPDWIRRMLSCDSYGYFDELSLHCYCQPDDVYPDNGQGETENNTKSYIELMKPYGEPKPVWISEMGWTTAAGNFRSSRESQAACFARLFAIVETSDVIERLCYYNFRDSSPTNTFDPEFQWGSIEAPESIVTNAAKESFATISCLNYMIGNAEFVSRRVVGKISQITYCENGEQIQILWSLDGNNDIMRYNRMAFAKTSNTGEIVAWRWFCVSNRSVGRFRNCKCDITRVDENTHYSIAIPWCELLPPNIELCDCDSFGFAFRVNYAESTDACVDGYAQLYSGIGHRRTALTGLPRELGRITLVKKPIF